MVEPSRDVALVTGGGSGIGQAIAKALAREGRAIGIVDLQPHLGQETVASITQAGGLATFAPADVREWNQVDDAVSSLVSALGPVSVLVNAAGVLDGYLNADEMEPELWQHVIGINLTGTFLCSKRALAEMLPAGRGRIINLASVAGLVGDGGGAAYVTSKHGVVGLTRQMAVTYADRGITVNAICPGPIATNLRSNSMEVLGSIAPEMSGAGVSANPELIQARVPLGRRGTVEEIAHAAAFLASESAAYITGHTLVVDGGWTAR